MRAFSVGFSAGKADIVDDQIILKNNTLYEVSTVSVPANAMALAKSKGIDISALEDKIKEVTDVRDEEQQECEACQGYRKGCPCKEPKEVKEEEIPEEPEEKKTLEVEETPDESEVKEETAEVSEEEDVEKTFEKSVEVVSEYAKEGRVLSKKNRKALEDALVALQKVSEADEKEREDKKTVSVNNTDSFIRVETPAVRMTVSKKAPNKARSINKAIRALLAEKRTIIGQSK